VGLEGELRIGLRVAAGRVRSIEVASTRPDVARTVLQGRTLDEVRAAVPLLFSICGRSQAAASELACAAAAGQPPAAALTSRCSAGVAAEMLREGAWRTLLDWPASIGERPAESAVAAARASVTADAPGAAEPAEAVHDAVARAALGMPADDWLAMRSAAELAAWAEAGATAAARFIQRVRSDEATRGAQPGVARPGVALLSDPDHARWIGEVAQASLADLGFSRQPVWRGAPAETGALARLVGDPLVAAVAAQPGARVLARFVARLRELALLLAGRGMPAVGAMPMPGGSGVAWVETARGLLIHQAVVRGGRVDAYRIVAPTEWNFHPEGALAEELRDAPAADRMALKQRATQLVHSLDPCVACRVEFDDA
jgi:hypothetical protein